MSGAGQDRGMALIPCYECEKEISDKAAACPQCGAPKEEQPHQIEEAEILESVAVVDEPDAMIDRLEEEDDLDLSHLTSAEGLKLPESMRGSLNLSGLTSAEGLKLPERIKGNLSLSGLTSAEGLKLPESMRGSLFLNGLTSAEGLKLPEGVRGWLDLSGGAQASGACRPTLPHRPVYGGGVEAAGACGR
jgi:hypothetical protein